jgi:hypothetical protein
MNVSTRKSMCEWLLNSFRGKKILPVIKLTNISARTPKSVQRVSGSQLLIRKSVVVWVRRRAPGASRFSGRAVHLLASELLMMTRHAMNILGAPALDNAGQPDLLWIISNIWSKSIYRTTEMPVWTFDQFWGCHPILQRLKYVC